MSKQNILFLAANPLDTGRLRLEAEVRDIQEGIQRSNQRDDISLSCKFAVRVRDLSRSLLDTKPQIVHFSGHGSGADGIVLENNEGESVVVGTEALANLFALHQDNVQCVVLNACYSSGQAEAICKHIPFVIGMSSSVDDDAAIAFAVGFYDAIGAGHSYENAFLHARNTIELYGLPGYELPILLKSPHVKHSDPHHLSASEGSVASNSNQSADASESRYRSLIGELNAVGAEITRFVHRIGMYHAVPFDQIYQPTKLLFRSGSIFQLQRRLGSKTKLPNPSLSIALRNFIH